MSCPISMLKCVMCSSVNATRRGLVVEVAGERIHMYSCMRPEMDDNVSSMRFCFLRSTCVES